MKLNRCDIKDKLISELGDVVSSMPGSHLVGVSDTARAAYRSGSIKASWLCGIKLPGREDNIKLTVSAIDPEMVSWIADVSHLLNY